MRDLHDLLDTEAPLIFLDTPDKSEVLSRLRRLSLHEGRIIYRWSRESGLYLLNDPAMPLPGTEHLSAAIKTLKQQKYRSHCVIDTLDGVDFGLLQQLSWNRHLTSDIGFSMLLLLPEQCIPDGLLRTLHVIRWQQQVQITPRLRNGQWIR